MKMSKVVLWAGLSLALLLAGCRSRQEAAGDKFRKGGDPINALVQYEQALARGKVSKEFYKNYIQVNIQCLAMRSKEDPSADYITVLSDTIASLLAQHPDQQNADLFAQALQGVGNQRVKTGDEEGGMKFLEKSEALTGKGGDASPSRREFLSLKLKEIEGDYKEASSEPTAGILADYKMSKLALIFGKEVPEMKDLWSKIRKINLNTYLMYDYEGLLSEVPDARINRFPVLLAVVKLDQGATSLKAQVKAFNGGSGPIHFNGDGFTLVDRAGNVFKPAAKIGAFGKKDPINMREESKTGGLTFNYPSGTEPWYLEFKSEAGTTRKYLP
jgi:hypothetical protein